MDGRRFDALLRRLSAARTRRGVLAAGFAGALAILGRDEARACESSRDCPKAFGKCKRGGTQCCNKNGKCCLESGRACPGGCPPDGPCKKCCWGVCEGGRCSCKTGKACNPRGPNSCGEGCTCSCANERCTKGECINLP